MADATRQRVLQAASALDFRASPAAVSLATGRTGAIGVLASQSTMRLASFLVLVSSGTLLAAVGFVLLTVFKAPAWAVVLVGAAGGVVLALV